MENLLVYPSGNGRALTYAAAYLRHHGIPLTDHPTLEVTHLLLDVPTGEVPSSLLDRLPENVVITGGNLSIPGHRVMDLLKVESYLAKNAAITAHCAMQVAAEHLDQVFPGLDILVIGWGRIGKCLACLMKQLDCRVSIAARKESDRAMAASLGFRTLDTAELAELPDHDVICNTVPAPLPVISGPGLKIELASRPGLTGDDVIHAQGLPGRYAPKSSGILIGETFLKEVMK